MLVLGLGGKPGSGKTTAAEAIKAEFDGVKIYSISDLICAELGLKRTEVSDARVLQDHGTRRREEDQMYWIRKVMGTITTDRPRIAVLPNVRMLTEVAGVRYFGGRLIRYTCLDVDGSEYVKNDRDMKHRLEVELDGFNWDFYITARCGESRLVEVQSVTLVHYLLDREMKTADERDFTRDRKQDSGVPEARASL